MILPLSVIVTKRAVSSERVALPLLASHQARTLGVRAKQARRLHANEDLKQQGFAWQRACLLTLVSHQLADVGYHATSYCSARDDALE